MSDRTLVETDYSPAVIPLNINYTLICRKHQDMVQCRLAITILVVKYDELSKKAGGGIHMIIGIGMDMCQIARMERCLSDDRFMSRYFTTDEASYIHSRGAGAAQSMAGLFASREALGKALGGGIDFDLKEAEIRHDEKGRPFYHLTGRLAERTSGERFHLSITHDGGYAAAICIRETSRDI